jgi:hypothetical protein
MIIGGPVVREFVATLVVLLLLFMHHARSVDRGCVFLKLHVFVHQDTHIRALELASLFRFLLTEPTLLQVNESMPCRQAGLNADPGDTMDSRLL